MKYFDLGENDFIPCEICGSKAVDIHHINGRHKDCNNIINLMALCRDCHTKAHQGIFSKERLQFLHIDFIQIERNICIRQK